MKAFPPRDWHYQFNNERELPLIRWIGSSINPAEPVAIAGWNMLAVMSKMTTILDHQERIITELLMLPLPDGRTVNELYKEWRESQRPNLGDAFADDLLTHTDRDNR